MSKKIRKAQVWIAFIGKRGEPQILLFKVIDGRGGGWHPVTGGVDDDETYLEGAMRELKEETQIKPKSGVWIDLEYHQDYEGRWGKTREHGFGFILKEKRVDPVLDPSEHTEFEWVNLSEAKRRVGFDSQLDGLDRFSCYLQKE